MQKALHEPLISLETYQRIQNRLKGRPVAPLRKDTDDQFPLRGLISCVCCDQPMTASLSRGRSRQYPYYFCNQKDCAAYRKNIRGETLEGDFETYLGTLRPHPQVITLLISLLRDFWQERAARTKDEAKAATAEITKLDTEIERTISRAIASDNELMARRYESRVAELETKRAALAEKVAENQQPKRTLDATIRTAIAFLFNPLKLWSSGDLEDRNLTLRLVYCPKQGVRT